MIIFLRRSVVKKVGRPVKEVDVNTILELHAFNYTWSKVAEILNISRATFYGTLEKAGVSTDDRTYLSDADLDDLIRSIKQDHPNDGEVLIHGHLVRMDMSASSSTPPIYSSG